MTVRKELTIDIETNKLYNPDKIHCAACIDHDTKELTTFNPSTIYLLPKHLENYDRIYGHNIIDFDEPAIRNILNYTYQGEIFDTLLMSRAQYPNRPGGHSVENWGKLLGRHKVEHKEWDEYSDEMLHRCSEDTEIQFLILQALLEEDSKGRWTKAYRLINRLFRYLRRQYEYGWYIDQRRLQENISFLERWQERINLSLQTRLPIIIEQQGQLPKPFKKDGTLAQVAIKWLEDGKENIVGPFTKINFRRVSLDKADEVKKLLLDQGWEPNEWNFSKKTGKRTSPKLSKDDDFIGVQGSFGRLITRYIQCKQRAGVLRGWKDSIDSDGRLRGKVVDFTVTGRIRHSIIVNVPNPETKSFFAKRMRQCFSTSPGMVMVGCDSDGNQNRQLASRMEDEEFTRAVLYGNSKDGTDLHSLNQERAKTSTRTTAKNFWYGLLFGASNRKLLKYGKATKEQFLQELPLLGKLINSLRAEWIQTARKVWNSKWRKFEYKDGYITGLDGRPILVDSEHKLLNYCLMSDEAIHMAAAYCKFNYEMDKRYEFGKDWGMLLWYHDEIEAECCPGISKEVSQIAEESIAWAGNFYGIKCPHTGTARIGNNWAEVH